MLLRVITHNRAHELFMNIRAVVGQQYYYIDEAKNSYVKDKGE